MGTIEQRKTAKGKTLYDAAVRRKGERPAYRTFMRLTDAKAWVQELEYKIRNGERLPTVEAERHTFADAIDRFILEELPKKPKIFRDQNRHLLWFKQQLGFKLLAEVSPALLTEIKGKFMREVTRNDKLRQPQTWNRYLTSISCVFESCCRDWQWLETNPARRVRREREAPGRVRFLSEEERNELLEACKKSNSPNMYPLVVLALSTGMRRSEIRWLTWPQVDLTKGIIILSKTKNKEYRRVSVRGLALELLRQHAKVRLIDCNYVFPGKESDRTGQPFALDRFWALTIKQTSLTNFRFHDLRHSTGSYLAMNGASLLEIAEVLGHKTMQMVKRYSHLAESHTATVVENMNRKIFGQ